MIKAIFKSFVLSVLIIAQVHFAYAQSASLLPNAVQTFLNKNGDPLSSGTVTTYIPNTTTKKTTWQDSGKVTAWANPLSLNAAGHAPGDKGIYGDGDYRQIVQDRNGNVIWDQVTSSSGSGTSGSGSAINDGTPLGAVVIWPNLMTPNSNYVFAYGQAISRATYPDYFNLITQSQTVSCIGGSPTLTGLGDISQLNTGAAVEAACLPSTGVVVSKTTNSVTLSVNANITTTTTATFYPYGDGDGITTFNVPDYRGRVLPGRDNMGGSPAARLTTTYYGGNPDATGSAGGNQFYNSSASNSAATGITYPVPLNPFSIIQPSITTNYIIRVLGGGTNGVILTCGPGLACSSSFSGFTADIDINSLPQNFSPNVTNDFLMLRRGSDGVLMKINAGTLSGTGVAGVTNINGQTGAFTCGAGVSCTGNNISTSVGFSTVTTNTSLSAVAGTILCDATSGNLTLTLPAANTTSNGLAIVIKRKDNSSNNCNIIVSGGGSINNLSLVGMQPQYASITFKSDGSSQWWLE